MFRRGRKIRGWAGVPARGGRGVGTVFAAALLAATAAAPALGCGPDADCVIGDRHYRIALPPDHDAKTPIGALVFAHGYRGTAAGTMRNQALRETAFEHGLALIALKSAGDDWAIPGVPSHSGKAGVDEVAYVDAVIADAAARFGIDTGDLFASGFSAGGMLVWNLVCERGDRFRGFVPMSGTFWAPVPQRCPTEVTHVVHVHGTADRIVPLEGRPIADARQGALDDAVAMVIRQGGLTRGGTTALGEMTCTHYGETAPTQLDVCLFEGGHDFSTARLSAALSTIEADGP